MRKSFYLAGLTAFFSILLLSCADSSKTEREIIKAMEESLNSSNKTINYSNQDILHALDEKRMDPLTSKKAELWYPRAEEIVKLSKECYDYIEGLKQKKISAQISDSLYNSIKKYQVAVLNIDPIIKNTFKNPTYGIFSNDLIIDTEKDFHHKFFKGFSKESINTFLTTLQNSVKIFENRTLIFCNKQIGAFIEKFTMYTAIVGQSSSIVGKGEDVEIIAGIGSFEKYPEPKIVINGKWIAMNDYNHAHYKFKAPVKPGKYFIPVNISYIDQDGKKQFIEKTVEYTVAKECDQ